MRKQYMKLKIENSYNLQPEEMLDQYLEIKNNTDKKVIGKVVESFLEEEGFLELMVEFSHPYDIN